jgi:hypothetical protein
LYAKRPAFAGRFFINQKPGYENQESQQAEYMITSSNQKPSYLIPIIVPKPIASREVFIYAQCNSSRKKGLV